MAAKVRVTRGPAELGWMVDCDRCPSATAVWPGIFGVIVVRAASFGDAIWWATWHAREHSRTQCPSCVRDREVEPVTVLDRDAVKVGHRRFRRVPGGWERVAA